LPKGKRLACAKQSAPALDKGYSPLNSWRKSAACGTITIMGDLNET
jgi:hypothetical protein